MRSAHFSKATLDLEIDSQLLWAHIKECESIQAEMGQQAVKSEQ